MFDEDKVYFDSNLIVDHKKRLVIGTTSKIPFDEGIEIRRLVYEMIQDPDIFTDMACEGHLNEEEKPYVIFCSRTQEKGLWMIQKARKFELIGSSYNDDDDDDDDDVFCWKITSNPIKNEKELQQARNNFLALAEWLSDHSS